MKFVKFPDKAFEYVQEKGLVRSLLRYIIDRKYRKSVVLSNWIREQYNSSLEDKAVADIIRECPNSFKGDYDKLAYWALTWVFRNIKYEGDLENWGSKEYWQTYKETLEKRTGDCEDGAILMYILCRNLGVPTNRLKILCGDVRGGGHAWLGYKPQTNPLAFAFMDWCYWYSSRSIGRRKLYTISFRDNSIISSDKNYIKMWWCFDEESGYTRLKPIVRSPLNR